MPEITLTIEHSVGLHARPASLFVQNAKKFNSAIHVINGERQANAKSIIQVLGLGAGKGAQIRIQAEGEDADQALICLQELVESNFGGID